MMNPKEYPLDHNSSYESIVNVFKQMKAEARELTEKRSYFALTNPKYREEALYLKAQEDLLENLIWALSGEAGDHNFSDITVHLKTLN
jgi:hypothetical protein